MTTTQLIDTLTRGAPVTARLVREIIAQLHALQWTRTALATPLERYANGRVTLEAEEACWVCAALDEHERLKEAVAWERECRDVFAWLNNTLANVRADLEAHRSLIAARKAVEELL